jgi:hypothetical protein
MSRNYTIINYFVNNKICIKAIWYFPTLWIYPYSCTPAIVLLGILCLINTCASDGQHNEPQQQQQQRGEQPGCQPATTPLPTLEQVLIMQAQLLQTMQQTLLNM